MPPSLTNPVEEALPDLKKYITSPTSIAPLAVFRVLFGLVMVASIVRFAARGWIYDLYIQPAYFFTYYGFDWVRPLGAFGMYAVFVVMGLAALSIMLGYRYRAGTVLFFLTFTYVELIDKTNYLNHYYFVSIIAFLLILVPANRHFSLDVVRHPHRYLDTVPAWTIHIFKLQLGIVYVFAGLAKLNPDWLWNAMPLRLWLPALSHLPVIGPVLDYPQTAYAFSWAGALYDLTIVFFLVYRRTRLWAYLAVVVFHLATAVFFRIGMFPYIMILCTLIYFSPSFHQACLSTATRFWQKIRRRRVPYERPRARAAAPGTLAFRRPAAVVLTGVLVLHFALQLLLPFRFALYPGTLFWTEQGYRFSWRVMLMEKAGYVNFHVHDPQTGRSWEASNWEYLTPNQEKMMATQPDMMLQFAHFLEHHYTSRGLGDVEITAESYVTLNGRRSRLFLDPSVDLTEVRPSLNHKHWILPFGEP